MIYEAKVTGRFNGEYWVTIPVKFGRQSFGPIRAVPGIDPGLDEFVYVGQVPAAETFVILSGTPIPTATITWANITGKPTTFTPATHTHTAAQTTSGTFSPDRLPAATSAAQGALPAADKAKLDAAASLPTAGTLAMRDAAGNLRVGTAASGSDATNKTYVDAQVATRAPSSHTHAWAEVTGKPTTFAPSAHTHAWADLTDKPATFTPSAHTHAGSDITSGTISDARIANATAALDGLIPKADKAKLDAATNAATANTLVMRSGTGQIQVATPQVSDSAANKSYVDAGDAARAPLAHTHSAADLTSGTLPDARLVGGYSMTTLRLTATTDASETSTGHAFQIGADSTLNIIIDNNEIIGRNNGVLSGINMPGGIIALPDPASSTAATRKSYVDTEVATRAPLSHAHSGSDITSGTISDLRIANATAALDGLLNKADKVKLDAATVYGNANTLALRNAAGQLQVATPGSAPDAANRGYVDGLAGVGPWVNVTIKAGFARQGTLNPQVRKRGNRVEMRWGWSSTGLTAWAAQMIGQLPAGYEPEQGAYYVVASSNAEVSGSANIREDGQIELKTQHVLGSYYLFDGISWDAK